MCCRRAAAALKVTKPYEGGEIGEKWSALEYLKILVLELKIKL